MGKVCCLNQDVRITPFCPKQLRTLSVVLTASSLTVEMPELDASFHWANTWAIFSLVMVSVLSSFQSNPLLLEHTFSHAPWAKCVA